MFEQTPVIADKIRQLLLLQPDARLVVVTIVIDESSSMGPYVETVNTELDRLMNGLRAAQGSDRTTGYLVNLVGFDALWRVRCSFMPVDQVNVMYATGRGTRLYQTVKHVLTGLMIVHGQLAPTAQERVQHVVHVITDGEDTLSPRPRYPERVQRAAREAVMADFQLYSIGVGISGVELSHRLGFPVNGARTVARSPEGITEMGSQIYTDTVSGVDRARR